MLLAQPWTLVLGGDIMLNAVAPSDKVWEGIAPTVRAADLAIANLEIPLTNARTPTSRKTAEELRRRDQFVLKADPGHAPYLARAGWDIVGLANNHSMDYGSSGLRQMQALLRKYGVGYAGAGENSTISSKPAVFKSKAGFRVALLPAMAFVTWPALQKVSPATDDSPGIQEMYLGGVVNDRARDRLRSWIGQARLVSDFVIVGFHWGTERKTIPNPYQVQLGRAAIESGADLVWGHHPHVLQGAEIYKGKPIFYSLGNLISPLPGQTALAKLTYDGREMKAIEILPAAIANGRVSPLKDRAAKQGIAGFRSLSEQLLRRFPSKDSEQPM